MTDRAADAQVPILALLRHRWSPRAFSDRPVETEKLCSVLEAAPWAPSGYNEQPWSFVVATKGDPAEFDRLLACLVEFNQQWARHAPVLMLSVAKLTFSRDSTANRHALHDVGLAVENLVVQATALGLYAHQMAGIHVELARDLYSIPLDHQVVAGIALGYLGDASSLAERLRERESAPRSRKPLPEFVFSGRWGRALPLVASKH